MRVRCMVEAMVRKWLESTWSLNSWKIASACTQQLLEDRPSYIDVVAPLEFAYCVHLYRKVNSKQTVGYVSMRLIGCT